MLRAFEILDDRMKLSLLSLLLGVGLAAPMAYGLVRPALFAKGGFRQSVQFVFTADHDALAFPHFAVPLIAFGPAALPT